MPSRRSRQGARRRSSRGAGDWSSTSFREEVVSVRGDVASDLDDDLPVLRQRDGTRFALEAFAVDEHGHRAAEGEEPGAAQTPTPDGEHVAEPARARRRDTDDS